MFYLKSQCSRSYRENAKPWNSLNEEYVSVRQKTCALHNACETLLHEQTKLTDNAEAIHEKLSYFQELDSIRSRLKNPNLEVNSEQFLALLAKETGLYSS